MTLSRLLNLTRPLIVPDTETTGLDTNTARIVELAFQMHYHVNSCAKCCGGQLPPEERDTPESGSVCNICNGTSVKPTLEYRTLVNPGVPIPAESTKVHGITDEMVRSCRVCGRLVSDDVHIIAVATTLPDAHQFSSWPTFRQLAPNLAKGLVDCDWAGKNVRYDLRVLSAEFARAGVPWSYAGARIIDADRLEALLVPRSLSHLYKKYTGQDLKDAHSALADVRATTEVIEGQFAATDMGGEIYKCLPRDLDALHELSWPGFCDTEGKFRFRDGAPTCTFGKWNGRTMRDIEKSYWDWILKSNFSSEVKKLAAEAKLGKFPEVK